MKKHLFPTALAVILALAATSFAQIKTGGYKTASKRSAEVKAAADFAVNAQAEKDESTIELDSIVKAETQLVAGMNYRLCLEVTIADNDTDESYTQFVQVVVFRSLKKEFKLTSWAESDCGEN